MSLLPFSSPPYGLYIRNSTIKSVSPPLPRLNRFTTIHSPFVSPKFNGLNCTPAPILPSPKDAPSSLMSKLFSEKQLRDALAMNELLEEQKNVPHFCDTISPGKRIKSESDSGKLSAKTQAKPTKFTEANKTLIKEEPVSSSSESESESEEENSSDPEFDYESSYEEDDNSQIDSDYGSPKRGGKFSCRYCKSSFRSAQALGGHMSRKHPGKSHDYNRKKEVRKRRELDRARLLLAKKLFYRELGCDYEKLRKLKDGKAKLRDLMNRAKLKKIKTEITKRQLDDFMKTES